MVDAGLIVIVAFISPCRAERQLARSLFNPGEFIEVFVDTRWRNERRDEGTICESQTRGLEELYWCR